MNTLALSTTAARLKWSLIGAFTFALAACGGGTVESPPTIVTLASSMSGDQELPPTVTGALGTGTLSLESPSLKLTGSFSVNGMTATAGHIHIGSTGVNGPVIVPMTSSGDGIFTVPVNRTITQAEATAFAEGGLYFNAHSADNPTGEVRGQIGREVFAAQMSSAQEIPTNASAATGNGLLNFDPITKKISGRVTLTGMSATAAHIHTGLLGANGSVIFPMTETAAGSGIWVTAADATLTDAQITSLKAGGLYFNAHSAAFPGGEIRGQIGLNVRYASLDSTQEVPTNSSTATGTGTLVVNPLTRAVSGSITLTGMTATAAHIHLGATGANGSVIVGLTSTSAGVFSVPANTVFTADQFKLYKQGNLYYNAHSAAFPGGEIRGQIR
ncbi:MAG: CHRD domain-containing protein [Polaromonas sp.]|nr:CHRD domain-containing protein [Polaromonas sp.]